MLFLHYFDGYYYDGEIYCMIKPNAQSFRSVDHLLLCNCIITIQCIICPLFIVCIVYSDHFCICFYLTANLIQLGGTELEVSCFTSEDLISLINNINSNFYGLSLGCRSVIQ